MQTEVNNLQTGNKDNANSTQIQSTKFWFCHGCPSILLGLHNY